MTRRINCEKKCGVTNFVPLHPDDVADGWQIRYKNLVVKKPASHAINFITDGKVRTEELPQMICDGCGAPMPDGTPAVAITMWRGTEPPIWETEFGTLQT